MFLLLAGIASTALAQGGPPGIPTQVQTQQLTLLPQSPVAPVTNVNATPSVQGNTAYYYWFVSYVGGVASAPAGPFLANNAPAVLGGINTVTLQWTPALGATAYDVLRTTSTAVPSGACGCAIATAVALTTLIDSSPSTRAYIVATPAGQIPCILTSTLICLTSNAALKAQASDAIQYVGVSGNDANDGLSLGSAKGNADFGVAIAAAQTAIGSNTGAIYVSPGSFNQSTAIACKSNITIIGYGAVVTSTVTGSSLVCANTFRSGVFGLRFIGPSTTGSAVGLQLGINSGGSGSPTEWNTFKDLWFTNFHYGVDGQGTNGANGTFYNTLMNVNSIANSIGWHIVPATASFFNDNSFLSVFSSGNTTDGYVLDGANGNLFSNAEGESNGGCGVNFTGANLTQGNVFSGGWLETNTTADICTGSSANVKFNHFLGTTLESSTNFSTLANLLAGSNTIISGNAGTGAPQLSSTVISGTSTMTSGAIAAATCQTAVTTAATGVLATDSIEWSYATAPSVTTDALLHVSAYVTAGNVNFTRCNPTAASITGTAIVISWRVVR